MRMRSIPAILAAGISGCAPLLTDGIAEIRHRVYAVHSDGSGAVVVGEETYLWDCGGTMARCYDRESGHGYAVFRVDPALPGKRDTLMSLPGIKAFGGGYADPLLYHSTARDRMLAAHSDSLGYHLVVADKDGGGTFDLMSLEGLKGRSIADAAPSPDFGKAALLATHPGGNRVIFVDLRGKAVLDSVGIPGYADTVETGGLRLHWESDSALVVYAQRRGYSTLGAHGFRVRGASITDTLPSVGCLPYNKSSSGPYDAGGGRLRYSDSAVTVEPRPAWRCIP